jgi:hypothetical protein
MQIISHIWIHGVYKLVLQKLNTVASCHLVHKCLLSYQTFRPPISKKLEGTALPALHEHHFDFWRVWEAHCLMRKTEVTCKHLSLPYRWYAYNRAEAVESQVFQFSVQCSTGQQSWSECSTMTSGVLLWSNKWTKNWFQDHKWLQMVGQ